MLLVKRLGIALIGALVLLFLALSLLGISPAFVINAPGVAAGMGAKLVCSSRFVSGFSQSQAFDDLVQYSPLLDMLDLETDDNQKQTSASFFGLSTATAQHLPGLGCAVDYAGYQQRQQIEPRSLSSSAAEWPAGSGADGIDPRLQDAVAAMVQQDNAAGLNTRALLVVHNGEIVAEAYDQGADAKTPLLGWSMAKSLTAIMLGNLELRGMIDLTEAPGFADWSNDERASIRTEHLLTMTDGLDFSEQYNPGDDATTMLFTSGSSSDYALARPLAVPPGSRFNYSSGTANILSRLYTDTLGSPQAAYDNFFEAIANPLGMQNAIFETDASGVFVGSSYLYASARDWARMGQLMLNEGTINGQRLVSAEWVERATAPNSSANSPAYGFQWWLNSGNESARWPSLPADAYAANGNRQQVVMVLPSENAVIVRLGWTAGGYPVDANFSQLLSMLP